MNWIISVPVLLLVVGMQIYYYWRCRALSQEDDTAAFADLLERFELDIVHRAKRGDAPDWLRYADEADRVNEDRGEPLRSYATAALATGIGGTMLALGLNLVFPVLLGASSSDPLPVSDLTGLIAAMGLALAASFFGVVNNLLILLGLLPQTETRASESLRDFQHSLRKTSTANPPHETFAEAIKSELKSAFSEAVQKFPEAFAHLDKNVQSLGGVIEEQSKTVVAAATSLKEGAEILAGVSTQISPAAAKLAASTDQLNAIPAQLRGVLDETRDAWAREIRGDQLAFLDGIKEVLSDQQELLQGTKSAFEKWEERRREAADQQEKDRQETVRLVQNSTADVVAAVAGLPQTFANHIEKIGETLSQHFGREARNLVVELAQKIEAENKALREQIEANMSDLLNIFLNSTSDVVAKTLQDVYRRVEGTLLSSLDEVGKGLKEAMVELPNSAAGFASSLSLADEKLQRTLESFRESALHLERVAELTDGFEVALATALREATAQHLSSFEPLQRQMSSFITSLQDTHAQINNTIESQVEFIRDLVNRLAQHSDPS